MIPPSTIPPIASRGTDSSYVRPARSVPTAAPDPLLTARPNPNMRIDPSLGIVVMEFRDRSGAVAATLPTERELDAYRSAQRRGTQDYQPQQSAPAAVSPSQSSPEPHHAAVPQQASERTPAQGQSMLRPDG